MHPCTKEFISQRNHQIQLVAEEYKFRKTYNLSFPATRLHAIDFVKRILMYECISETEIFPPLPENVFIPNVYSDISGFIEEKIRIMKIYDSEIHELLFPRSVENIMAVGRFRGSTITVEYAEVFMLIRDIF